MADSKKFLKDAVDRFKLSAEAEATIRSDALDDYKFAVYGDQWPSQIIADRKQDSRPALVMNRLPQMTKQVINQLRQMKPAAQINPVGDGATIETAEIIQGLVRHIELNSESPADVADDKSAECMINGGIGYQRVISEYVGDDSFDQDMCIEPVENPFSVYFDPFALKYNRKGARWCFITSDVPMSDYEEMTGKKAATIKDEFKALGDSAPGWMSSDNKGGESIRIAEYYYFETKKRKLIEVGGKTAFLDELSPEEKDLYAEDLKTAKKRDVVDRKLMWSKISAIEILEGPNEQDGKFIPVIPVIGDEWFIDGNRFNCGLVRWSKDPQRQYNYWITAATEKIALMPKAPTMVLKGQIDNYKQMWELSNRRNFAVLPYDPVMLPNGQAHVAPPQRLESAANIGDMALMVRQADNDIKATTGIYDASLGQQGPDQSGKAILARQKQGDIANFNFSDNLARAIRYRTQIIIDLIPHIYDAPRIARIVDPDGSAKHVAVFNSQQAGVDEAAARQQLAPDMKKLGLQKVFDIGVGRYDVTVSVGPTYQSKRQEAVQSQLEVLKIMPPQAIPMILPQVIKNMDWPGAQDMANKLQKMVPPEMQDDPGNDPKQQVVVLQSKLQALSQQHDLLAQRLMQQTQEIESKSAEIESKERIVRLQEETKLIVAQLQAKLDEAKANSDNQLRMLEMAHEAAMETAAQQTQPQGEEAPSFEQEEQPAPQ